MRNLIVASSLVLCSASTWVSISDAQDSTKVPSVREPEMLNVVAALDSAGALVSLDRVTAKVKLSGKLTGGVKSVAQLPGPKATVRFAARPDLAFVIKLASGVDPATIKLYAFESKKDKREVVLMDAGYLSAKKVDLGLVPVDVAKHGESSYKLIPTKPLPVGEFGFSSGTSNDIFSFGVDAVE